MGFIIIFFMTIIIQCVLVEFGGTAVKTYALDLNQNLFCLAIGSLELVWGLILKFLPIGWFQFKCLTNSMNVDIPSEDEEEEGEKKPSGALALKRASTQRSKTGTKQKNTSALKASGRKLDV